MENNLFYWRIDVQQKITFKLLLSFLFFCISAFQNYSLAERPKTHPNSEEIVKLFKSGELQNGLKGYTHASKIYFNGRMDQSYKLVREALSAKEFTSLKWESRYDGSIEEFFRNQKLILEDEAEHYRGREGYLRFANEFYEGKLGVTYSKVTLTLNATKRRRLSWKKFSGEETQLISDRREVLKNTDKYKGKLGYLSFTQEFYPESMQLAFENISAALSPKEFKLLNWGHVYRGTPEAYETERERVLANLEKYKGVKGYIQYSDEFYNANMDTAFTNVSAVLTGAEMKSLGWPTKFYKTTVDYKEQRDELLNSVSEYYGAQGYIAFANKFYDGEMGPAAQAASSVLGQAKLLKKDWGFQYKGSTEDFSKERGQLLQKDEGNFVFYDMDGYVRYSNKFQGGNMSKTFERMSAALSAEEKTQLGWGLKFKGYTEDHISIRSFLKNTKNEIDFEKWFGKGSGLLSAADSYLLTNGYEQSFDETTRLKIRYQMRAAVTSVESIRLGWNSTSAQSPSNSRSIKLQATRCEKLF